MGTNFCAQVEVFNPATEYSRDSWQSVSRWELQKDYSFSLASNGFTWTSWGDDVCLIGDLDAEDVDSIERKRCFSGEVFALIEPENCFVWFIEAREHVKRLIGAGYRVRVLTWAE